jgi:hypothetical protein
MLIKRLNANRAASFFSFVVLLGASIGFAAEPASPSSRWVRISDGVLKQLADDGKKTDWPGESAGIAVDPSSGDVYMIIAGQGVWKSTDQAKTFERCDAGTVGGRCETAFSINADPAGKRLAFFMLDGKGAWTGDRGKTWGKFADVGRNWDYAAVDWSVKDIKTIFAGLHESGGKVMFSGDGGKSWKLLFTDPVFDKTGGLGVFDENTLVYTQKGKGIQRSADQGKTWTKVADIEPIGRVVQVLDGTGYWLSNDGLLVSKDKGMTWKIQGSPVEASIGPWLDPKNEKRFVAAGKKGIFQSEDGGTTWQHVANLPEGADIPMAGWYSNVAWDPVGNNFYVSKMGKPAYRLAK